MGSALENLKAAAEAKAAADKAQAQAADSLADAVRAAIADPDISTAAIREITGLSNARVYQINKG
ncbi:hypothetical protein [Glutamicibacter halophytocola]|uniref:Uncharacterized protein n=1 Tax=Glutamicibacter halophytocola TaxID=1933880 RepID=A0AA95BRC3_9MICC|nr:hypothetical protein [Glutamicibacter halophytocola]UUX60191.1 hypothetical protein NUH22_06145 [Glutamicibacter halophytocola]